MLHTSVLQGVVAELIFVVKCLNVQYCLGQWGRESDNVRNLG